MNLEREVQLLRRELARLQSRVPLRPVPGGSSRDVRVAVVMGGNSINPGATSGIAYTATAPVSIPLYVPSAVPSTVDGVGTVYDAQTGEYLLVANYASAAIFAGASIAPRDYFAGELVILGPTTTLPITASSATSTLYVIIGVG